MNEGLKLNISSNLTDFIKDLSKVKKMTDNISESLKSKIVFRSNADKVLQETTKLKKNIDEIRKGSQTGFIPTTFLNDLKQVDSLVENIYKNSKRTTFKTEFSVPIKDAHKFTEELKKAGDKNINPLMGQFTKLSRLINSIKFSDEFTTQVKELSAVIQGATQYLAGGAPAAKDKEEAERIKAEAEKVKAEADKEKAEAALINAQTAKMRAQHTSEQEQERYNKRENLAGSKSFNPVYRYQKLFDSFGDDDGVNEKIHGIAQSRLDASRNRKNFTASIENSTKIGGATEYIATLTDALESASGILGKINVAFLAIGATVGKVAKTVIKATGKLAKKSLQVVSNVVKKISSGIKKVIKKLTPSFGDANNNVNKLTDGFKKLFAMFGLSTSFRALDQMLEKITQTNDRLNTLMETVNGLGNANSKYDVQQNQQAIANAALATYTDYNTMGNAVMDLYNKNPVVFSSLEKAASVATSVSKAGQLTGMSGSESMNLVNMLANAELVGTQNTSSFTSLFEGNQFLQEKLAQETGADSATTALRQLRGGMVTAAAIKNVFVNNADEIAKYYDSLTVTVSKSYTNIKTKFSLWLSQLDQTYQIQDKIAKLMDKYFDKLMGFLDKIVSKFSKWVDSVGGLEEATSKILKIVGAIILLANGGTIFKALKGLLGLLNPINLVLLGIVNAITKAKDGISNLMQFVATGEGPIAEILKSKGKNQQEITATQTNLQYIFGTVAGVGDKLKDFLSGTFSKVDETVDNIYEKIISHLPEASGLVKQIAEIWNDKDKTLGDKVAEILGLITTFIKNNVPEALKTLWTDFVKPKATEFFTWIETEILHPLIDRLIDYFSEKAETIPLFANLKRLLVKFGLIESDYESNPTDRDKDWKGFIRASDSYANNFVASITASGDDRKQYEQAAEEDLNTYNTSANVLVGNNEIKPKERNEQLAKSLSEELLIQYDALTPEQRIEIAQKISEINPEHPSVSQIVSDASIKRREARAIVLAEVGLLVQQQNKIDDIKNTRAIEKYKTVFNDAMSTVEENGISAELFNSFVSSFDIYPEGTKIRQSLRTDNFGKHYKIPLVNDMVPLLAQGGYVPANSPRLAIVGDNKTEGEIISPISKLKETFADVLNVFQTKLLASTAGFEGDKNTVSDALNKGFDKLVKVYSTFTERDAFETARQVSNSEVINNSTTNKQNVNITYHITGNNTQALTSAVETANRKVFRNPGDSPMSLNSESINLTV